MSPVRNRADQPRDVRGVPMSTNAKTRAIVSAFNSGFPTLRAAAAKLVDDLVSDANHPYPAKAIQAQWGTSKPTSYKILKEREKYTRDGRRR